MKQDLANIKILLLDIEGTICPISFVKDTLFPYALDALPSILETKWNDPEFAPYKTAFPESAQSSPEAFLAHVQELTEKDVKIAYLKNLQGYLWQTGYETGVYNTPLFPDVLPFLHAVTTDTDTDTDTDTTNTTNTTVANPDAEPANPTTRPKLQRIAIYSSGSIFAQKLLFAHIRSSPSSSDPPTATTTTTQQSQTRDYTSSISAWYDTTNAGPKTSSSSYAFIAADLLSPSSLSSSSTAAEVSVSETRQILFLSDNVKEIQAALLAGMRAVLVEREGNAPITQEDKDRYDVIDTFEPLKSLIV